MAVKAVETAPIEPAPLPAFKVYTCKTQEIENLAAKWLPIAARVAKTHDKESTRFTRAMMAKMITHMCQSLPDEKLTNLICSVDEIPLAFIVLKTTRKEDERGISIEYLCAHPNRTTEKGIRGAGLKLIQEVAALAFSKNLDFLQVEPADSAKGFYEKCHFSGDTTFCRKVTRSPSHAIITTKPSSIPLQEGGKPFFLPTHLVHKYSKKIIHDLAEASGHGDAITFSIGDEFDQKKTMQPKRYIINLSKEQKCTALAILYLNIATTIEVKYLLDTSAEQSSIPLIKKIIRAFGQETGRECMINEEKL
ncbi:MAG: hypothetical protein S4CHLAM27_11310 [Chlamydiia bacterium]|nr:hypothetical protein [Chlamydiia bacterium]